MKRIVLFALVLSITFATGCAQTEESTSDVSFTSTTAPAPTASTAATDATPADQASQSVRTATSAVGDTSIAFSTAGDPSFAITEGSSTRAFRSERKESGKRKYYDSSGMQIAEVKSSDSGFKVRTVDGSLLWKVKITDEKIKVSDNEENMNPWVLKTGYLDKAKIVDPNESEVGVVRFADPPAPTRVRSGSGHDEWTIDTGSPSAALGVLMMSSVSREHQAIIVTELLERGR